MHASLSIILYASGLTNEFLLLLFMIEPLRFFYLINELLLELKF